MSEYGSGVSFAQSCAYDKERIKMALQGKLLAGETRDGFEYADATKEECERYILSAYDNAVYHARQAFAAGRAMETVMKKHGFTIPFLEYVAVREMEAKRDYESKDYKYEIDLELERIEGETDEEI